MASSPQHEPTMEEILASIRKIISEDSSEAQPAEAEAKPHAEADVLDLTQEVHDEPPPVIAAPPPAPEPTPEPVPVPVEVAAAAVAEPEPAQDDEQDEEAERDDVAVFL